MIKSLVIVFSYHHNNTKKVANTMAKALGCEVAHLEDKDYTEIPDYDRDGIINLCEMTQTPVIATLKRH